MTVPHGTWQLALGMHGPGRASMGTIVATGDAPIELGGVPLPALLSEDAMLELDYAAVAELFPEGDLVLDESAADVAASLHALEQGNFDEAGSFYGNMARRWGRVQSLAFSS